MDSIQEFQSMVLNLENERRIQDKEIERNGLTHRWYLIYATMPIVFISEMVPNHLSSMVESSFNSLWLIHGQIVSRGNSTGLGHINILLDLSFTVRGHSEASQNTLNISRGGVLSKSDE